MDFRAADFGLSGASIEYGRIVQLSHESCCDAVSCGAERIPKEGLELFGCALISGNLKPRTHTNKVVYFVVSNSFRKEAKSQPGIYEFQGRKTHGHELCCNPEAEVYEQSTR